MSVERIIGIDFGTSTSVMRVKRYRENGQSVDDRLYTAEVKFGNSSLVPTLIREMQTGEPYYGYDAQKEHKKSTLFDNFKVELESPDPQEREQARALTEAFFTYLSKQYKDQSAGGFFGEADETESTIVSYPVKWSGETRRFMLDAAKKAGFKNVEGMDEAQAAITAVMVQSADYLSQRGYLHDGVPANILMADMGAGTTDLVLCRYTPGKSATYEILSAWPKDGGALFGGREVEGMLRDYLRGMLPEEDADIVMKRCGLGKFKSWKEDYVSPALGRKEAVTEFYEFDERIEDLDIEIEEYAIDRDEFEKMAAAYLKEFPMLVNGCLEDAGLSGDEVDLVLLTGGHSQWYFVREQLCGKLERFGAVGLGKIQADPERIIPVPRPQETVALGLVYSPLMGQIQYGIQADIKGNFEANQVEEEEHAILCAFNSIYDQQFWEGENWIEYLVVMYGDSPIRIGQEFALYTEDGDIECILPVVRIEYDNQPVSLAMRTEKSDMCRVRFEIDKKKNREVYENIRWIISEPITERTYSETLFPYTKVVTCKCECLKSDSDDISESFKVLVQSVDVDGVVNGYILGGELDADKEMYIYKSQGCYSSFSWEQAEHSFHSCSFSTDGSNHIEAGDIISDYALPSGYTYQGEIDPKVSWKSSVQVVQVEASNPRNIPSDSQLVLEQGKQPRVKSGVWDESMRVLPMTSTQMFRFREVDDGYEVVECLGGGERVSIPSVYKGKPIVGIGKGFQFANSTIKYGLKEIEIGGKCRWIGEKAFDHCVGLEKIIFHQGLEEIGEKAFMFCEKLSFVEFPEGLVKIGEDAFKFCKRLSDISFSAGLKEIGEKAFGSCNLKKICIPESCNVIDDFAFSSNKNLTEVRFNSNAKIKKLGSKAFLFTSVQKVELPMNCQCKELIKDQRGFWTPKPTEYIEITWMHT